jgi:hypothetical protein
MSVVTITAVIQKPNEFLNVIYLYPNLIAFLQVQRRLESQRTFGV